MVAKSLPRPMALARDLRWRTSAVPVLALIIVPLYADLAHSPYYFTLGSRILVYALAALSLDFILGYGGLPSFGHAMFLSLGAYSVAIPASFGWSSGWIHLGVAIAAGAALAGLTGLVALRTRGVSFIMITLAFAQMVYFLLLSLKQFGGDEGLSVRSGSQFGMVDLAEPHTLYGCLALVVLGAVFCKQRLVNSPFGMVLQAAASNEARVEALGYSVFKYRLVAYVLAGTICSVAGVFLVNGTLFASPSYGTWDVSGTLMVMVALGGAGSTWGAIVGAAVMLGMEEILKRASGHWLGYLGAFILLQTLLTRHGLSGLFNARLGRQR